MDLPANAGESVAVAGFFLLSLAAYGLATGAFPWFDHPLVGAVGAVLVVLGAATKRFLESPA